MTKDASFVGRHLGSYHIVELLGVGGMGEVYRARDARLGRDVAVKILPRAFAADPERLARFEREARTLAALNHQHVGAIYGLEDADGVPALVLELVEGDTLADQLRRGPIAVAECLNIARQIAEALQAAHERHIVHRDLKPANIKVTPEGVVKVLDFGLAKALAGDIGPVDASDSPTVTAAGTRDGVILGTAAYMSPEQARGRPVDKRADLWAFGVVLYEMLTGRRAFEGGSVSDTLSHLLTKEPDWTALPPETPASIRKLLRRCLTKDRKYRLDSATAARLDLVEASELAEEDEPASSAQRSRLVVWTALAGAVAGAVGIALWLQLSQSRGSGSFDTPHVSIAIPPHIRFTYSKFVGSSQTLIVSGFVKRSDGTEDPRQRLFVRNLESFEFKEIPGTEGLLSRLTWTLSPDERSLAFVVGVGQLGESRVMRVPLDGSSPPVPIAQWDPAWHYLKWLHAGDLLIMKNNFTKIFRLPVGGGSPGPEVTLNFSGATGIAGPLVELPDGRGLMRLDAYGPKGYQEDLYVLDFNSGKATRVLENGRAPYYDTRSQHLFFSRHGTIQALPFDLATLAVGSEPIALADGLRVATADHGVFDLDADGTLVFPSGGKLGDDRRVVTVEANRDLTPFTPEARPFVENLALSADGSQLAAVVANAHGKFEVWTSSAGGPRWRRTIADPIADVWFPVWSPDGRWIAFWRQARDKKDGVYLMNADGTGDPLPVLIAVDHNQPAAPSGWLTGSSLMITRATNGVPEAMRVPIANDGTASPPESMRDKKVLTAWPVASPDGKLIAFIAADSGRTEVWVAELAGGKIGANPVPVGSTGAPDSLHWAADSRRLFYKTNQTQIMLTTIERSPALRATPPKLLHDLNQLHLDTKGWTVMPDGRLIGVQLGLNEGDIRSFNVVLNWLESARQKLAR